MKKNTFVLLVFLGLIMVFLGINYFFEPFRKVVVEKFDEEVAQEEPEDKKDQSAVETIFDRFDDRDRVGQLLSWPIVIGEAGVADDNDLTQDIYFEVLSKKNAGFYTLFGSQISTDSARQTVSSLVDHNGSILLPWIAVDHEGGSVQRLSGDGFTRLAAWNSICDLDKLQVEQVLGKSALELKEVGVNIVLAPMVDIGENNGVLGKRICSSNPDTVVGNANIFINKMNEQGIMSVLKHFPGIGNVNVDLHDEFAVGRVGVEDVFVYRTLLELHPEVGVMTSHIGLDNQFADIPCSMSSDCVGELTDNFQKTLVFTDALEMKSAFHAPEASNGAEVVELTLGDVSKNAVLAGNNVLVYGPSVRLEQMSAVYDMLVREYNSDPEFKKKVDSSVKKIIAYKLGVPVEDENKYPAIKQN